MIVITLQDTDVGKVAHVNAVNAEGTDTYDVSQHYSVRELIVTDSDGTAAAGWFVSKKIETPEELNDGK